MTPRIPSLALGLALLAPGFAAAAPSPTEIINYKGPDRAAQIEAGARKEGVLTLYTGGSSAVLDDARKKWPWLKIESTQSDGPAHVRRATEEYKAGKHIFDAIGTSNGPLSLLRDAGVIQPFYSPEMDIYRDDAVEPKHHWVLVFESYVSLGYNTKAISPSEIPRKLDDLLDPKWAGKMSLANTTTPNWIGAVFREKGDKTEEFLRKLAQQKVPLFKIAGRAMSNLVVSGEVPISPAIFSSHMADSKREGASVGWYPLDGVYANISSIAVAKYPPHPYAAMLYVDWMLSKEGQLLHQAAGYASGRRDMENAESPKKRYYLADEPDYPANFEKWEELSLKIFGKAAEAPKAPK
jgi:iron(III) transport system substrate-binding protein